MFYVKEDSVGTVFWVSGASAKMAWNSARIEMCWVVAKFVKEKKIFTGLACFVPITTLEFEMPLVIILGTTI